MTNTDNIAEVVLEAGGRISAATGVDLPDVLNSAINRIVGWPYRTATGFVVDADGTRTEPFTSVVQTVPQGASASADANVIPTDHAAAVIDGAETLDLDGLRAAYARVALAKRFKKSPAPKLKELPSTTTTLGIIFAQRSAVPLEDLAAELQRLNAKTPHREWPDMVAVASSGTLQYAVQFPGEALGGNYLPPAQEAVNSFTAPFYVVLVIRPVGAYTFNKMLAYLVSHLAIFSPGASVPSFPLIDKGSSWMALTITGYQYTLSGELAPVPREFYSDRYLPPLPIRIEGPKGELLSTVRYLPWQDGGVILLRGKLPLVALTVYLGKDALQKAGVVHRPPDLQISYVLPITAADFAQMLNRLQSQSNLILKPTEPSWTIQKIADEGSTSPFMARLFMGLLRLRDVVYPDPAARDAFDAPLDLVLSSLMNARTTAKEIADLWNAHSRKVSTGKVARLQGKIIHVDEAVDKELRKQVESFLNAGVRALKQGMQNLATELKVNIGFLFKQQSAFETGITALSQTDVPLAEYLRLTRTWSERLVGSRNDVEHNGWTLPRVQYKAEGTKIVAIEPEISGQSATQFATFMLDRLSCFVEAFTAHCLQVRMDPEITITEIPIPKRLAEAPERFILTPTVGGMPRWNLAYHSSTFEET